MQATLAFCFDLITIAIPPALPACMIVGVAYAVQRLRQKSVFCIAPTRVNMAGKVNRCCFDKTGTLTRDGLDLLAVPRPPRFAFFSSNVRSACSSLTLGDQSDRTGPKG